jgi:UPF0755 protein
VRSQLKITKNILKIFNGVKMSHEISSYDDKKKPEKKMVVRTHEVDVNIFKKYWYLVVIFVIIVIFPLILSSYVTFNERPLSSENQDFTYFEIKKGESKSEVGSALEKQKIIRSAFAFRVAAYVARKPILSGHYKVASSMSTVEILKKMQKGEVDAFQVTIPEGYRVLQIAKLMRDNGQIDVAKFIESAIGTEGHLFPDTYVFPKSMEAAKIIQMMKDNYDKRITGMVVLEQQLILASIVEREAIADDERPQIAAVYQNRINKNMLMQADPTVQYGLDTQKYLKAKNVDFDFWKPLVKGDLDSLNSSFNTYKQKGIIPAPICNPGLKSIQAAVSPTANFDYLYFFHDKNQKIHFSKTYQEHLQNIQQFGVSGS